MPVEVKELIIRAVVAQSATVGEESPQGTSHDEDLISQCVEQVLKILKKRKER